MWFGDKQMPSICKECIESWHKVLPADWSFQFWNDDNYDVETKNNFVLQAYRSGNYAFVSDYARWDILHRYGGVYVDTDVFLLKDITPLLNNKAFGGVNDVGLFASGLILGAEPNLPIFAEMIKARFGDCADSCRHHNLPERLFLPILSGRWYAENNGKHVCDTSVHGYVDTRRKESGASESQSEIGGALRKSQIMFHVKHQHYEGIVQNKKRSV